MVSLTSNAPQSPVTLDIGNTPASASATNSTNSFAQQLLSALESFLGQSGNGSQVELTIQQEPGQNSGGSQYLVTLTNPEASTESASTASAESASTAAAQPTAAASTTATTTAVSTSAETEVSGSGVPGGPVTPADPSPDPGMPVTTLAQQIQSMEDSWAVLTPQQVAFQLANAAGTGGGSPTATVPGTTLTFGDLNQVQQLAYQYGTDFGTNGMSMQDFLEANAGPDTAWNLSYNQIQANAQIQAAVDPSYQQAASSGVPAPTLPPNEYATPPATSGNPDNLPNPALIPYLPADQQAAAWAALAAAGEYGSNIAGAAQSYANSFLSA